MKYIIVAGLLSTLSFGLLANDKVLISDFENTDLSAWETKSFVGETQYELIQEQNKTLLKASSSQTASGIALEKTIDLKATPFLNWSWKIDNQLSNLDEKNKTGDDYAARLYVVKSGGWQIWKTRALNYVWSSNQLAGSHWDNAFVGDKAKMLAVRGQEDIVKNWHVEKRNVYQDLIRLFGDKGSEQANEEAYRYLDALAIMTDTDNSKQQATAYYADIYFSAE